MENDRETEQWLRLVHSGNPSLRDLNRFVQARSPGRTLLELNPDAAMHCLDRILATCPEPDHDALSADLRWLEQAPDRWLLPITDPRYPPMLREIPDPPLALYASGSPDCLSLPCLAIVGSRNPTPQGRETATAFARQLAGMGFTVVSGLARGIDGCAHRGALESGRTVGVCAHGLDTVYPRAHRALAAAMSRDSVLVSEFPPEPGCGGTISRRETGSSAV
jgi:DNA processing protein